MRPRPWPITALALIHLLAPIPNVIISAWLQSKSPWSYFLALIDQSSAWGLFDAFGLLPLVGMAIYLFPRWSYVIFGGNLGFSLIANFAVWNQFPKTYALPALMGSVIVNLALLTYFILPKVRASSRMRKLRAKKNVVDIQSARRNSRKKRQNRGEKKAAA